MDIRFDKYSLILNNHRELIRSGAMHYFRLPHPKLWRDRLQKLKMAGYNTVDIYFSWDFHSKAPGEYDFTGPRDINRLLDMIEELGLYLIGRPGPYINAETTRGGLPGWLLTEPDVLLRNREDGVYQYSPRYMQFVREWFEQILPFLKGRENLLMIQIENEYSTVDMEPDYMEELLSMVREQGITVPSMHNDFYAAGLYADIVDIYAIDNYSVTAFDWNWRTFPDIFSVMDHLELETRPEFCPNRPLMVAELQAGWFAGWKGVPYQKIHESLGRDHIGMITRSFLGQGGTIFNHYKAIGGTNWNHLGATDAYTSYDFSAPISESGLPTERLYEAKRINLLLSHFDWTQTDRVSPEEIGLEANPSLYTVRKDLSHQGAYWIITRNLTSETRQMTLKSGMVIETLPYHSRLIPYHLPLEGGCLLKSVNVEPLAQSKSCLILTGEQSAAIELEAPAPLTSCCRLDGTLEVESLDERTVRISLKQPLAVTDIAHAEVGGFHVYFLGADMADRLWKVGQQEFLIGPDLLLSEDGAYLAQERPCWKLLASGETRRLETPALQSIALPELENWRLLPGETEAWEENAYSPLSSKGADMDNNGFYEGAVWYRYEYQGKAKQLSVHAQHIWAVMLNGTPVIENNTFHIYPDRGGPDDMVTFQLPQDLQHEAGSNVLTIFVESLGHHKGFYDDAKEPRGVLALKLDDQDIALQGKIRQANLSNPAEAKSSAQAKTMSPVIHAITDFELNLPADVAIPIGLEVDLDVERVNITLNGVLLGKFWRSCKNQTVFYLPEGILNPNGTNHLVLTLVNFLPMLSMENPFPIGYGKVKLYPYEEFFKLSCKTIDT